MSSRLAADDLPTHDNRMLATRTEDPAADRDVVARLWNGSVWPLILAGNLSRHDAARVVTLGRHPVDVEAYGASAVRWLGDRGDR